jgi:copper resistance protein B
MTMRPLTFATPALGLLLAGQVLAQDHSQHQTTPVEPETSTEPTARNKPKASPEPTPIDHAAMGHAMPAPQQTSEPVDHAAMGHGTDPTQAQAVDHAAVGHDAPDASGQMDHAAMGHTMPSPSGEPRTPIPDVTDADRAAAFAHTGNHAVHDNTIQYYVLVDRLEVSDADEGTGLEWEAQSWIGTDLDKLWLRSEGERAGGHTEAADLEVLYGRAFAPWWDVVAGVRHDFKPGDSQDFLAIGVMGLAPYKFEVEATAYLGERGQTGARFELEYETLLTNRLILQPQVEVNLYGKNDPRRGIGSGLSTAEAGLRLRYEFTRQFAPYIGIVHERAFGRTADFRRDEGEDVDDTRVVAGVRIWF